MNHSSLLPSNPIESFMRLFRLSYPDAPGCASLYYSKKDESLCLAWLDHGNEFIPFRSRIINPLLINKKFRDSISSRQIAWQKFSPLPSEIRKVLRSQPEVFDTEIEDVLIFRHLNIHDNKIDLIFFDFGKWMLAGNKKNRYINLSDDKIKKTFVDTLNLFFRSVLKKQEEDHAKWELILSNAQSLVLENQQLKQRIETFEKENRDKRLIVARNYLSRVENEYGVKFALHSDAENKIKNFHGSDVQLTRALLGAITFAREIGLSHDEVVYIGDQHIHFNHSPNYYLGEDTEPTKSNRFAKTIHLLDRFEKAALIVKSRNEKLTSSNLGKYCEPKTISPPGIRDAIKNHKDNILVLLEKRQEDWYTIRNEFKPILNLLNDKY